VGQDHQQLPRIEIAIARKCQNFTEDLQPGRAHRVARKFDQFAVARSSPTRNVRWPSTSKIVWQRLV
jgi:hypothetical protein